MVKRTKKQQKQDLSKTALKKYDKWLEKAGNLEVLVRDLENYKNNPSINYSYFVEKYNELDRQGNYKSQNSLDGTIRRVYNQLDKTKVIENQIKAIQLKNVYVTKKKRKYGNIWNSSIFLRFKGKFRTEKSLNLPNKQFGAIGFYKKVPKIRLKDFMIKYWNNDYLGNAIDICQEIGNYFNAGFVDKSYTSNPQNKPIVVRIRVWMKERYSSQEKVFSSGYIDTISYLKDFKDIWDKYYEKLPKNQAKYKDNIERWYIRYICIDTKLVSQNNFLREIGLKKSYYGNFF